MTPRAGRSYSPALCPFAASSGPAPTSTRSCSCAIAAELGRAARCARGEPGHGDRVEQGRARRRRPARGRRARRRRQRPRGRRSTRPRTRPTTPSHAAEDALSARAGAARRGRRRAAPPAHARRRSTGANLAIVSTPGRYAAAEALKALAPRANAFVFSDNVPIAQEVELKRGGARTRPDRHGARLRDGDRRRRSARLRQRGPRRGHRPDRRVRDRAAAGLEPDRRLGRGREPDARRRQPRPQRARSAAISMLDAIDALAADPATRVLGLVSKPPDPEVAGRVLARRGGERQAGRGRRSSAPTRTARPTA